MKIAFNCRCFLKKKTTGIGRYAWHLLRDISKIDKENQYVLYAPLRLFDFKRKIPEWMASNFMLKKDYFKRGVIRSIPNVDIYHAPCPEILEASLPFKTVVTIHDLIFKAYPSAHTAQTIELMERQMDSIVKTADRIICISQSTVDDLVKYYHVNEKNIRLIYNGVDKDIFYAMDDSQKAAAVGALKVKGIEGPFLLFVGTIEPRKNLRGLLEAYRLLKEKGDFKGKLVVVGMKGWLSDGLEDFINQLKIQDDVIFSGYVTNDELRYLYNLCEVFVFPSFYEGFGFPIVEAFACQAAVVTSNVSSPAEIAGDCALTIDPDDSEQIAFAVKELLDDPDRKKELIAKAKKRSEMFSFNKTAEETLKVYREFRQ